MSWLLVSPGHQHPAATVLTIWDKRALVFHGEGFQPAQNESWEITENENIVFMLAKFKSAQWLTDVLLRDYTKQSMFNQLLRHNCHYMIKLVTPSALLFLAKLVRFHHDYRGTFTNQYFDHLVQDCSNSSALAMELLQSCIKPSNCKQIFSRIRVELIAGS